MNANTSVSVPLRAAKPASARGAFRRWFYHVLMRQMTLGVNILIGMAKLVGSFGPRPRRRVPQDGWHILLTGSFHSDNWIRAHVLPLVRSRDCTRVYVVSAVPLPALPKVVAVYPPPWLVRVVGATAARLLVFLQTAILRRPDVVGGFALLANGLAAAIVAPLVGARSLYFCVGGPIEVLDGGVYTESGPLARMQTPDRVVERRLLRTVGAFDLVITMGTGGREFFRDRAVPAPIHVVSGGIDADKFQPAAEPPVVDLVLIGRLVPIKRVDTFLHALRLVTARVPGATAAIVGDGLLRPNLEELARELGLADRVTFVGATGDVDAWLKRSRIFVLTSESEGLSLALMEAMMAGLPAVVSRVGDLADLVADGVNGFLVDPHSPAAFAERIAELLRDESRRQAFSNAARDAAMTYETANTTRRWEAILSPAEGEGG